MVLAWSSPCKTRGCRTWLKHSESLELSLAQLELRSICWRLPISAAWYRSSWCAAAQYKQYWHLQLLSFRVWWPEVLPIRSTFCLITRYKVSLCVRSYVYTFLILSRPKTWWLGLQQPLDQIGIFAARPAYLFVDGVVAIFSSSVSVRSLQTEGCDPGSRSLLCSSSIAST